MATPPLPVVKAFLVCDHVIQDAQSGKKSLIGLFHEIKAVRFPTVHPELWIYANLTDAHGRYTFEIVLIDANDPDASERRELGRGVPPPIDIPGPLHTTELSAQLRNLHLPRAGTYEFHLLANGQLAATKAVRVSLAVRPQGPPHPERRPGESASGDA